MPTASQLVDLLGKLGCDNNDHNLYRRLIRQMSSVKEALIELQCNRWGSEPRVLGQDIAAGFDLIVYVFDIETFVAGACLIRIIPIAALWPVAEALLSNFNAARTIKACGYPTEPTSLFNHTLLAMIMRDRQGLQPYIYQRFRWVGAAEVAWLEEHVSEAMKRMTMREAVTYTRTAEAPRKRKAAS